MNKVILSGRIANEIEVKTTSNEVSVCNFRIAVQRRIRNAEGNYDTDFINCTAWRGNAIFINNFFKKGDPIEIEGKLQTREYEKDGLNHYITEVIVDEASFTQSKKQGNDAPAATAPTTSDTDGFIPTPAGDLPF